MAHILPIPVCGMLFCEIETGQHYLGRALSLSESQSLHILSRPARDVLMHVTEHGMCVDPVKPRNFLSNWHICKLPAPWKTPMQIQTGDPILQTFLKQNSTDFSLSKECRRGLIALDLAMALYFK